MAGVRRTTSGVGQGAERRWSVFDEADRLFPALVLRRMAGRTRIRLPELDALRTPRPKRVVFVCPHSAGRSQMAAAFFNELADPARARAVAAGTDVAREVDPGVVRVMAEAGIPLPTVTPRRLSGALAASANDVITLGCIDECPFFAGVRVQDWPLADPRGKPVERIRRIRDSIRRRVEAMIEAKGWGVGEGGPA